MSRARLLLLFAVLLVPIGLCPAQGDPRVIFDSGFYNEEILNDSRWRWMAEEGIVKLKNQRRDMLLKFSGRAPIDAMPAKPIMKVLLNGEPLEQFEASEILFEKEYKVPAAKLGNAAWIDLKITTSKFIIPSEVNKKISDDRHLGFKLSKLTWTSAAGDDPPADPEEPSAPSRVRLTATLIVGLLIALLLAGVLAVLLVLRQQRPVGLAASFCCADCLEKAHAELAGMKVACSQCGKKVQFPKAKAES